MAKILVADDNSNIQKMVGLALKDQGIDVVAVGNGEAAVRKLADVKPDLVLADVFMPVRNGYEVCKFVKDDPAFAHVPVILLVGAFDPLDEQEAQRVGADGVLKKPFVPPDPLISMVKSALARAGVVVGTPVEEKPKESGRSASDLLRAHTAAKLAAVSEAKLPEAEAEPLDEPVEEPEEFPAMPSPVKIDAGEGPVAFGSLLGTAEETVDDTSFLPAAKNASPERSWGAASDEEGMEVEEEPEHGGWRPSALEEVAEPSSISNGVSDWRDEAFHGSSPAHSVRSSSSHWTPSAEKHEVEEFAEAPAVGVSMLDHKTDTHEPALAPFSGDAWAAAIAAGEEEKAGSAETVAPETDHLQAALQAAAGKVLSQENLESNVPEPAHAYENEPVVKANDAGPEKISGREPQDEVAEPKMDAGEIAAKPAASATAWFSVPPSPWDLEARKVSQLAATWDAPPPVAPLVEKSPDETQDIAPYHALGAIKTEESFAGRKVEEVAPAPMKSAFEEPTAGAELVREPEGLETEAIHETVFSAEAVHEAVREELHLAPADHAEASESGVQAPAPNMDEVVARVLEKLNPEVLHKVTQEILKPIIEALVKDELKK